MTRTTQASRPLLHTTVLVLLLALLPAAAATTYRQLSLSEILDATEVAFVGTVRGLDVEMRDGLPWTIVEFAVERALEGETEERTSLAFLGGSGPGIAEVDVQGMPAFELSERVLVLAYDAAYYSPLVGFNQGLFRLQDDNVLSQDGTLLGIDEDGSLRLGGFEAPANTVIDLVGAELEARR